MVPGSSVAVAVVVAAVAVVVVAAAIAVDVPIALLTPVSKRGLGHHVTFVRLELALN